MSATAQTPRGATVSQLKADIDAGRTGDKVDAGDPGLSPLGTDDEAAGRPADSATVAEARRQERAIGHTAAEAAGPNPERAWFIPALLTVLVLIVIAAAVYGLALR